MLINSSHVRFFEAFREISYRLDGDANIHSAIRLDFSMIRLGQLHGCKGFETFGMTDFPSSVASPVM